MRRYAVGSSRAVGLAGLNWSERTSTFDIPERAAELIGFWHSAASPGLRHGPTRIVPTRSNNGGGREPHLVRHPSARRSAFPGTSGGLPLNQSMVRITGSRSVPMRPLRLCRVPCSAAIWPRQATHQVNVGRGRTRAMLKVPPPHQLAITVACVTLNLAVGKIANLLSLPLSLDTIGSLTGAALLPPRACHRGRRHHGRSRVGCHQSGVPGLYWHSDFSRSCRTRGRATHRL